MVVPHPIKEEPKPISSEVTGNSDGLPFWFVVTVLTISAIAIVGLVVFFCLCVFFKKEDPLAKRKGFYIGDDDDPISLDMIALEHKEEERALRNGTEENEYPDSM